MENCQTLFPRAGLCAQLNKEGTDKSYYCYLPEQYHWVRDHHLIPYYQLEIKFLADLYSQILGFDYDRNDPCTFVSQYRTSPAYLDQMDEELYGSPVLETLLLFYQHQGDQILNNYLRSGLRSAIDYLKSNRESISYCLLNPEDNFCKYLGRGLRWSLEQNEWSLSAFVQDLNQLNLEQLGLKYEPFIDQRAKELQSGILKAPSTPGDLVTFRYIKDLDHLNLGEGQVTRLEGFTSTTTNANYLSDPAISNLFKLAFIIPAGSRLMPFIHYFAPNYEDEVLLPHGTRIVYERTLKFDHPFDMILQPRTRSPQPETIENDNPIVSRYNHSTDQFEEIDCHQVKLREIYVFRVLHDPWEVQAALVYNPLNYNLYGSCLDSVSAQTGVPIETLKRLAEQYLFHQ